MINIKQKLSDINAKIFLAYADIRRLSAEKLAVVLKSKQLNTTIIT